MKKRSISVSKAPVVAKIEKFSHDGRGIARIEGKITFIDGALPDELVEFQYLRQKKDFDEGKLISIIQPSALRAEPRCAHYSVCGGCSLQHLSQETQIQEKQNWLLDLLARHHLYAEEVLPPLVGPLWHYRNKARLSVRFVEKKQSTLVGFREKNNPRYITEIENCFILHERVHQEITSLRHLIDTLHTPQSIAQIEVAAGDEEVALVFRNLTPLCMDDEDKLIQFAKKTGFRLFLQPAGPDSMYLLYPQDGKDFLHYSLPQENIHFQFHPSDFTQINLPMNRQMITRAIQLLDLQAEDTVLDLFCGLGNFSLPIAKHCKQVVGIEGSEAMVSRAKMNANFNQLSNLEFLYANLEEATALASVAHYGANKLLLDPPRTGAASIVKHIDCIHPSSIVYVSCNPATLARDAEILVKQQGYQLTAVGVMDMFPHTSHVESIALFTLI